MAENDCEEKVIGFPLTEQAMEPMEPSGAESSWLQTVKDLQAWKYRTLVQVGGDISAKEGWRIAVSPDLEEYGKSGKNPGYCP